MKTKLGYRIHYVFFCTVPPWDSVLKFRHKHFKYHLISAEGMNTEYLFEIFDSSKEACKTEIIFTSNDRQENEIRESLLAIATKKRITDKEEASKTLAQKMYEKTDQRNGVGLFVIMLGKKDVKTKVVLARFKGAEALQSEGELLKYLEQVFTKQAKHYKLAVYEDLISEKSFWKGYAIDKQTALGAYRPFSDFWIEDFLQSETSITSSQGTAQLCIIIKNAIKKISLIQQQEELISAVINLKGKANKSISVKAFCENYLSDDLRQAVKNEIADDFYNSVFTLDSDEYERQLGNTVLTIKGGIIAFVPTFMYDSNVREEITKNGAKKIVIEGLLEEKKINGKKLSSSKSIKPNTNAN